MFGQKRGLSDVVTVTLIILLAISAVVIVWVFVRSTLLKVGGQIEGGSCVSIDLKPIGCNAQSGAVTVANGPGDTTVTKVKLVYYASGAPDSESVTRDGLCTIEPLAQKICTINPNGVGGPNAVAPDFNGATAGTGIYSAGVAAVIGTTTCTVSEKIIC